MTLLKKRKLIAIVGPTASGKTSLGVKIAKEFGGEIVSADSRQVFCGLNIGTGKDLAEYNGVKYHMIDIKNPKEQFTLFDYLPLARAAIEDIFNRGKLPIIVGGTGLYVQALVEGFALKQNHESRIMNYDVIPAHSINSGQAPAGIQKKTELDSGSQASVRNDEYGRERLGKLSIEQLNNILQEIDIDAYQKVDINNPHRLIRAIEKAQERLMPSKTKPDFETLQIGIDLSREELNKRIDRRVDERFKEGMLEEVVQLLKSGVSADWLMKLGLEYKIITNFILQIAKPASPAGGLLNCSIADIDNSITAFGGIPPGCGTIQSPPLAGSRQDVGQFDNEFKLMKDELKLRSHQYAKRQMTWFKRFPEIFWSNDYKEILSKARLFLKS